MTTLPYRRQQVTPRSGGRIAGDRQTATHRDNEYPTAGSAAVQPRRLSAGEAERSPRSSGRNLQGQRDPDIIESGVRAAGSRLRVAPPAPVTTPRAPFVALVLFLVMSGVLGILVLNTKINENAFRLKDLRDRQSRLDLQEQQLTDDLALAASPNSLAAAARRLGLVPAGSPAFIRLPDGRVLGVPQPATGQQSLSGPQAAAQPAGR
jgi:hypothetical protein